MRPLIEIKRVYEKTAKTDGCRILVDRLWPRGVTKEAAAVDEWVKELAPTAELRTWFGHDPEKWGEFQKRYKAELKANKGMGGFIEKHRNNKLLTLVYSNKDEKHTHARVLRDYLEKKFQEL